MPQKPLVSVICVCYNQGNYVSECLQSVLNQDYSPIELIITDDASTDNSLEKINEFLIENPSTVFIQNKDNIGHCATFNKGLKIAKGKYIIDLAADDLLLPNRISQQVAAFEKLDETYAVVFTDAYIINEKGETLNTFYKRDERGKLTQKVPSGFVYKELIRKMVISSPTMMMRKSVLDELGGYDETLSYEDYDFWVRSSRKYKYHYLDALLTKKRKVSGSQGIQFYRKAQNQHLASTLKVCKKAQKLNQNKVEDLALAVSVGYHLQLAFLTANLDLCKQFFELLITLKKPSFKYQLMNTLANLGINVYPLYTIYLKWFRKISLK